MVYHKVTAKIKKVEVEQMKQIFGMMAATMMSVQPVMAEETYDYKVVTVERCDQVVIHQLHLLDDEATGSTGIRLPNTNIILYGEFDRGHLIEFGYIDQVPVYNEDSSFDWGAWVNGELQAHGHKPLFNDSMQMEIEPCSGEEI